MKRWVSILLGVCVSVAVLPAWAGPDNNPLAFYLGGGVGSSNLGNTGYYSCYGYYGCNNYWHDFGWKVFGGFRPIPFLGAQLEYTDFGHSNFGPYYNPPVYGGNDIGAHAASAFAVGYLPLPFFWDLYAKAGASALWSHADLAGYCGQGPQVCALGSVQDRTTAEFGYGGGVQSRFGMVAVRLEYERIGTASNSPALLSADFAIFF